MMHPASLRPRQANWQRELAHAIRDPETLLQALDLPNTLLAGARRGGETFGLRVPRGYVARMRPGNPDDPLLRQVLPLAEETVTAPGFTPDPVGDMAALHSGGVLHKYHGRALLVATGACAVHCRYCFRRAFPYGDHQAARGDWSAALDTLSTEPSITEVILSGGDPLSLNDRKLARLARGLAEIDHLRRLRIHSRLPVVLPERVDEHLLAWLTGTRLTPVMVIHANHPAELDGAVAGALRRLRDHEVTLLNQAVLLRGVNDQADTLVALSERLFELGVMPYYLHLLDPVAGAAHFEVPEQHATALMRAIAARLAGYLVPRLVRETPGRAAKSAVAWDTVDRAETGALNDPSAAPDAR